MRWGDGAEARELKFPREIRFRRHRYRYRKGRWRSCSGSRQRKGQELPWDSTIIRVWEITGPDHPKLNKSMTVRPTRMGACPDNVGNCSPSRSIRGTF